MKGEQPSTTEGGPEEVRRHIVEMRDRSRESATELQRNIEESQSAIYGRVLLNIMKGTGDNPDIVNGLSELLRALDLHATASTSKESADQPFSKERQEALANFLKETAEELRSVGGFS